MVDVVKEDIFNFRSEDYNDNNVLILVDPINCNLNVMGKGLALEFKKRYPKEFKKGNLKDLSVGIGEVAMINTLENPHVNIMLFPTKLHWSNPSEYWYISANLTALKYYIEDWVFNREHKWDDDDIYFTIRMPKLGCGLGGLDFNQVLNMIKVIFHDEWCEMFNVKLLVCDNG